MERYEDFVYCDTDSVKFVNLATESMLDCIHNPCATCKYNTSPEGYFCEMEHFEPKPID